MEDLVASLTFSLEEALRKLRSTLILSMSHLLMLLAVMRRRLRS